VREIGRRGQGPGEYEHLRAVVHLSGDSTLLIDGNTRGTLLGPDLTPARYLRLPSSSLSRAFGRLDCTAAGQNTQLPPPTNDGTFE
jgi:hypothetical protein